MKDGSYNQQEEVKEIRHIEHDAEYNKLIEQYGHLAVYNAESEYNWFLMHDIESSLSFAEMCDLQNKKLNGQVSKFKNIKIFIKNVL